MAVLGLTEVQAVNRLLRATSQNPVAALDAAGVLGTSIQARAQEVLEEIAEQKLIAGYEENTINVSLQLDLPITAGTLSAVSAAAQPVITTSAAHGITTASAVEFYGVNSYPTLTGPYTLSAASGSSLTLAAGQITTSVAAAAGAWKSLSQISVPASTLRIIGNGQDAYRTFSFDATLNKLSDVDRAATLYFSSPVQVKRVFLPGVWGGTGSSGSTAFESLKPETKEAIATEAAVIFQRRMRGSSEQDQQLVEEAGLTEIVASRPTQNRNDQPVNIRPITMVPPQGRQQQGQ